MPLRALRCPYTAAPAIRTVIALLQIRRIMIAVMQKRTLTLALLVLHYRNNRKNLIRTVCYVCLLSVVELLKCPFIYSVDVVKLCSNMQVIGYFAMWQLQCTIHNLVCSPSGHFSFVWCKNFIVTCLHGIKSFLCYVDFQVFHTPHFVVLFCPLCFIVNTSMCICRQ